MSDDESRRSAVEEGLYREEVERNSFVTSQLMGAGDDCLTPRPIEHFFHGSNANLARLTRQLGSSGKVTLVAEPEGIHFEEVGSCELGVITRRTLELRRIAAASGVEYDGWEAVVVRPEGKPGR